MYTLQHDVFIYLVMATHPAPSEISGDRDRGIADGYVMCYAISIHHGRRCNGRSGEHAEDDSGPALDLF